MSERPHPAAIEVNGHWYLRNAKAALVPIETVKPMDLLIDELVRAILEDGHRLADEIRAFKLRAFERVGELQALLAQDYETTIGGVKGNITLPSYDGCGKVQVAVADRIEFGPELQVAKTIIDECLTEWSATSHVAIRALVDRVFSVEKEGTISHAGIFMLLRTNVDDERWKRAMQAIRDSIRSAGSATYMRLYERPAPSAAWNAISLNVAQA